MSDAKQLLCNIQQQIDDQEAEEYDVAYKQAGAVQPRPTEVIPVAVNAMFNIRDERFIRQRVNPFLFYKHVPIALLTDTAESYDNLSMQWSFSNGQFNERRDIINSKDLIKNIIGMRISSGRFPWLPMSSLPFQRQIYILVDEFAAFSMRNRWINYHFIMNTSSYIQPFLPETQYGQYEPSFDGYFWFPGPVQDLNTITLRFAVQNMYFDARRVPTLELITPTNPEYKANPMELPYPDSGAAMVDGQRYYFANTAGIEVGTALQQLTSQAGQVITDIGGGYFTVPIDGSGILSFNGLRVWVTPATPIDFSITIDLIYLGDQDVQLA